MKCSKYKLPFIGILLKGILSIYTFTYIYILVKCHSVIQVVKVKSIKKNIYIKQKILSCKCSEYATIKSIIKNTDGIGNNICEYYVACKSCSNIMSHVDSIEFDINPWDDDDIDDHLQI